MKIELVPSIEYIDESGLVNKTAIIIDVLRATSVITTALYNGALEVIPVIEVEEALKFKDDNTLVGGERRALKVEGFDVSNSPLEYSSEVVKGKKVVLSTTNGTKAIYKAALADKIVIGSMLNGRAVGEYVVKENKDIVIICAGTYGKFSLDDFICAGKIANDIMNRLSRDCDCDCDCDRDSDHEHDDFTAAAIMNYDACKGDLLRGVSNASHYKYLVSIGLSEDIKYCFSEDRCNIVPLIFKNSSGIHIKTNI